MSHHIDTYHSWGVINLRCIVAKLSLYDKFISPVLLLNISYINNTFCIKRNSLYTNQNSIPKL